MHVVNWTKRGFDIVVGSVLLVTVLPVIAVAAIGTAITLRANPFFTQTRVGRDGKMFRFLKLRTLPTHTNPYAAKYELDDLELLPWFSRTLRLLHLDELPQLFFGVSGKMSLVGPRPEMPYLHDQLEAGHAALRTSVRPGCTGLWQISEHCDGMIHEHPEFDDHYVSNWSFRFDLWIIGRTLRMMLPIGKASLARMDELPAWATRRDRRTLSSHDLRRVTDAEVRTAIEA